MQNMSAGRMDDGKGTVDCFPHPSTVTKQLGGGYGVYQEVHRCASER